MTTTLLIPGLLCDALVWEPRLKRLGGDAQVADQAWIAEIGNNPEKYRSMTREDFIETFGSEGAELIMWLVMRGAMDADVRTVRSHYYSPASMTGTGMVVLENEAA